MEEMVIQATVDGSEIPSNHRLDVPETRRK